MTSRSKLKRGVKQVHFGKPGTINPCTPKFRCENTQTEVSIKLGLKMSVPPTSRVSTNKSRAFWIVFGGSKCVWAPTAQKAQSPVDAIPRPAGKYRHDGTRLSKPLGPDPSCVSYTKQSNTQQNLHGLQQTIPYPPEKKLGLDPATKIQHVSCGCFLFGKKKRKERWAP